MSRLKQRLVEYSQTLAEAGRANLRQFGRRLRCPDVTIVTADARSYEVPDDVTHVYLYNPFLGEVFEQSLAQLVASLDRRSRTLRIVYANPVMHEAVLATGRFRLVRRIFDPRARNDLERQVAVYESVPRRRPRPRAARLT
jgi:hypothetical protein